jgi:hypothetical protein
MPYPGGGDAAHRLVATQAAITIMCSSRLRFRYCSVPMTHASLHKKLAIPEHEVCSEFFIPSQNSRLVQVQASVYIDVLRLSVAPELGQYKWSKIGAMY